MKNINKKIMIAEFKGDVYVEKNNNIEINEIKESKLVAICYKMSHARIMFTMLIMAIILQGLLYIFKIKL